MYRRNDGFTLVELMVVVLIMGILVAVAVPVFKAARDRAEYNTCQANQRTILGAVSTYEANEGKRLNVEDTGWDFPGLPEGAEGLFVSQLLYTPGFSGQKFIPNYLKSYPSCPSRIRVPTIVGVPTYNCYFIGRVGGSDNPVQILGEGWYPASSWYGGSIPHGPLN